MRITLYSREGCHLCEDAKRALESAGLEYEEIDIDGDSRLRELYNEEIPVIEIDGVRVPPAALPQVATDPRNSPAARPPAVPDGRES